MRLPFAAQTGCCSICARPVEGFSGEYVCDECKRRRPSFDSAAVALRFEGHARDMILDFKFNRHLWLRDDFSDWLEAAVRARFDVSSIDAVLPMPASVVHRWDRGYNQCDPLARILSRRIGRRFDAQALSRRGCVRRQASLNEIERAENVKNSFKVARPAFVRGRTLLLVDDILTTGSTLSEASGELKRAGAYRVWVAALARSIRD